MKNGRPHGNTRYTEVEKAQFKKLFVQDGKTLQEISEQEGAPSRPTLERFCREGSWVEQRKEWQEATAVPLEELEERAYRKTLLRLEKEGHNLPMDQMLSLFGTLSRFKALLVRSSGVPLVDAVLAVTPEFEAFMVRERQADASVVLEGWKAFLDDVTRRAA